MKKSLLFIPFVAVSFLALSCSSNKGSSFGSSALSQSELLQEAMNIQNATLTSSYVKIEMLENITTISYTGRSDNEKTLASVTKIKDDDEGWCYIFKDSDNHDIYHVGDYTYTDYPNYVYKQRADDAYYHLEHELKPVTKDASKKVNLDNIIIDKKEDENLTVYTYRLTNFESLFHQITDNEYKTYATEKKLTLPQEMVIYDYVKKGRLYSEQTAFTFVASTKTIICAINIDFSFDGSRNLPQKIKDEINKEDSNLGH